MPALARNSAHATTGYKEVVVLKYRLGMKSIFTLSGVHELSASPQEGNTKSAALAVT